MEFLSCQSTCWRVQPSSEARNPSPHWHIVSAICLYNILGERMNNISNDCKSEFSEFVVQLSFAINQLLHVMRMPLVSFKFMRWLISEIKFHFRSLLLEGKGKKKKKSAAYTTPVWLLIGPPGYLQYHMHFSLVSHWMGTGRRGRPIHSYIFLYSEPTCFHILLASSNL